jgi:hypothetical protein
MEDELGRECSMHGRGEECIQSFGGKSKSKDTHKGRPAHGLESSIKMNLRETEWGDME